MNDETQTGWTLVNFLRGNDYMPALRGASNEFCLSKSLEIRQAGGLVDIATGQLKANGLYVLFQHIQKQTEHMQQNWHASNKSGSSKKSGSNKSKSKSGQKSTAGAMTERHCSGCKPEDYFQALAWTLLMYRQGCCPNVDFVYHEKSVRQLKKQTLLPLPLSLDLMFLSQYLLYFDVIYSP